MAMTVYMAVLAAISIVLSSCGGADGSGDDPDHGRPGITVARPAAESLPNILMIAVDDLNYFASHLGMYSAAQTPNIDRIALSGTSFSRAYAAAPACNPSRTALFTGRRPHETGIYRNPDQSLGVLRKHELIPQYLARHGYRTMATGKLFHQISANKEFFQETYFASGSYSADRRLNGISSLSKNFDWGPLDIADDNETPDFDRVNWAIRQLEKEHDAPFFLAVGLVRPHLPWTVPRKYFEEIPLDDIEVPPGFLEGDLEDLPRGGRREGIVGDHEKIVAAGMWKEAIRAYLASVLYADAAVGRLWDALQASDYKDDTIVILWGDHGWQFGEKERWRKFTLWSAGSQTTLLFSSPSQVTRGQVCDAPVDLMAVYPTIVELAGLMPKENIDGDSIASLLKDCSTDWAVAALTTNGRNNHAVRYRNWSYIRHANRDEELYDRNRDPWEWHNLAADPDTSGVRSDFAGMLPCWAFPIVGSIGCQPQSRH